MKYVSEFRDPGLARRLVDRIRGTATRPWTLMEVCGGQTHSLLRHGIDGELAGVVETIHGPGCPVCVTPVAAIDSACRLSEMPGVVVTTFGDMLRVPGSQGSLADRRAAGGAVRGVYGPMDAVEMARRRPDRQIVFFAVGFETTAPVTALAVRRARQLGLRNFRLLVAHVTVLPAMQQLAAANDSRIDGFLAAGHVCTVTGFGGYRSLVDRYRLPVVVTGFEPVDLLAGIARCVEMLEAGRADIVNAYGRAVREDGNEVAWDMVREVYETCDLRWRGIGPVPGGGLRLRKAYRDWDAAHLLAPGLDEASLPVVDTGVCRSGEVLSGKIRPTECEAFGTACQPATPLGAPMVSSEGACAAYFRYSHGPPDDPGRNGASTATASHAFSRMADG